MVAVLFFAVAGTWQAMALDVGARPSLSHEAGVEARRSQTEQRIQQRLRASRAGPSAEQPAARARREHLERLQLEGLQTRQQREAGVVDQSARTQRAGEARTQRYHTLRRFEREQAAELDRTRAATARPAPISSIDPEPPARASPSRDILQPARSRATIEAPALGPP